jgi:hypothetical protein
MIVLQVTITDQEIMKELDKKKSTFYYWKKTKYKEYRLIREAMLQKKVSEQLKEIA